MRTILEEYEGTKSALIKYSNHAIELDEPVSDQEGLIEPLLKLIYSKKRQEIIERNSKIKQQLKEEIEQLEKIKQCLEADTGQIRSVTEKLLCEIPIILHRFREFGAKALAK